MGMVVEPMSASSQMNPKRKTSQVRDNWIDRQRELGKQPRAVLMKGLHERINTTIDRWHRAVMRAAFPQVEPPHGPCLDLGCGYGRLADAAAAQGLAPVVGIDFARGFCSDFRRDHGPAVCGDLAYLPFPDATFAAAYSVTSYMYLPIAEAQRAVAELDRCLAVGSRVLLVEPSREFNSLIRTVMRTKRNESLTMPGFSIAEFRDQLVPGNWQLVGSGSCRWMTALLPLMMASARFPGLYRQLERLALRMDAPAPGSTPRMAKVAMYRWAVYSKIDRLENA